MDPTPSELVPSNEKYKYSVFVLTSFHWVFCDIHMHIHYCGGHDYVWNQTWKEPAESYRKSAVIGN